MNDDVIKQLELKNKEIYLKKLEIDIDNNFEILNLTIDNMINLFSSELLNKILEIENSNINRNNISINVNEFFNLFRNELSNYISRRKNIFNNDVLGLNNDVLKYQELITKETTLIINNISKYYLDHSNILFNQICIEYNEFDEKRLNDLLYTTFKDKLILKIKEIFNNTDLILINNYQASIEKFNDLNNKTVKY